MNRKILALLLALTMLLSLCACGGGDNGGNNRGDDQGNSAQNGGGQQDAGDKDAPGGDNAQTPDAGGDKDDGQTPDADGGAEKPDTEKPDEEKPDAEKPIEDGGDKQDQPAPAVSINYTDITLRKKGEALRLKPVGVPETYAAAFASKDEAVATVDKNGTVTAAAPGTTTVTVHVECASGQYDFACIVRCRWQEKAPETPAKPDTPNTPSTPSTPGTPETPDTPSTPAAPSVPSLSTFYSTLTSQYTFGSMGPVEGDTRESWYTGLSAAAGVEEVLIMEPVIGFSTNAVALVKMSESASAQNIQTVKGILQSRINYQVESGAFYPQAVDAWAAGQVVSAGRYVGMFVHSTEVQSMVSLFTSTYGG